MKHINFKPNLLLLLIVWMLSVACSDDAMEELEAELEEEIIEEEEQDEDSDDLFYQLIRIENLATNGSIDPDIEPTASRPTIYFSLEDSTVRDNLYLKTNQWDISFGSIYNSFIGANNGDNPDNLGFGANGIGGIMILEENFDNVIEVPSDDEFLTGRAVIGTDSQGAFGDIGLGVGWYLYDFGGTVMGDGSYNKMHVAYALQDTRTIVVRTARGNYAKVRMISCYQDAFTPEEWFRDTPHMYFTFEYVMVPAGSTSFEIRG